MNLGTKARYAVMAMVDIASQSTEKPVKLADISERQEIPLAYLEQIFSRLKQQALVDSIKGPGGGYKLAHEAKHIPISDIVMAADESIKMTRCESHSKVGGCMANKAQCLTHDLWEGLSKHIYDYFHAITLEDVLKHRINRSLIAAYPAEKDKIKKIH